ncbi:MAG TPA: cupin domain-containing protein [Terriglobales bacterium]|nr:cupin domain-containing protein [Terriglobales bacterium]
MSKSKMQSEPRHLSWSKIEREQMSAALVRQYVSGEKTTLARVELKKGCVVPEHHHENEQICFVLEGALKFCMPDSECVIRAGELLVIPPHVPHEAEAVEESVVFDFFAPARADWEKKQDSYLRNSK